MRFRSPFHFTPQSVFAHYPPLRVPRDLREPPALSDRDAPADVRPRYVLLINPFYAKDPHASFGKHVLTPTLALTAIAGATPAHWQPGAPEENPRPGAPPPP